MEATILFKLAPITVPNYIFVEKNTEIEITPITSLRLQDLDAELLSALCDEFRTNVFKKAEKIDPRSCRTSAIES